MKKILRNCLLWLSFLFVISCHKNEEAPTATMTFLNNNTYASNTWAVVSGQSGKVLVWKSLPVNVSTSLIYPSGKDSVNLTIIEETTGSNDKTYYTLSTFANVATGSYSSPAPFQYPPILGTCKVQNPSPTDYNTFQVSSECGSTVSADHQSEWQVSVCANSSLFVQVQKTGLVPRYLYLPQISANGSVVIDQTKYNSLPEMKVNTVALGDTYSFTFFFLSVIKDSNSDWLYISSSSSDNANSQPLYYPDQVGSAFDEYYITAAPNKPNVSFEFNSTVKDPSKYTIPTFTPTLDVVNSATISHLDYNLSGNADYVNTRFSGSTSSLVSYWNIYNSFSKKTSLVLPIFPDDLKKEIDFSFIAALQLQSISIGETDLGGYKGFYTNNILGEKKRPKNSKYKKYTPKADGSIGGGG